MHGSVAGPALLATGATALLLALLGKGPRGDAASVCAVFLLAAGATMLAHLPSWVVTGPVAAPWWPASLGIALVLGVATPYRFRVAGLPALALIAALAKPMLLIALVGVEPGLHYRRPLLFCAAVIAGSLALILWYHQTRAGLLDTSLRVAGCGLVLLWLGQRNTRPRGI